MQVIINFDALLFKLVVIDLLFLNSFEGKDKFLFISMKLFRWFILLSVVCNIELQKEI